MVRLEKFDELYSNIFFLLNIFISRAKDVEGNTKIRFNSLFYSVHQISREVLIHNLCVVTTEHAESCNSW